MEQFQLYIGKLLNLSSIGSSWNALNLPLDNSEYKSSQFIAHVNPQFTISVSFCNKDNFSLSIKPKPALAEKCKDNISDSLSTYSKLLYSALILSFLFRL